MPKIFKRKYDGIIRMHGYEYDTSFKVVRVRVILEKKDTRFVTIMELRKNEMFVGLKYFSQQFRPNNPCRAAFCLLLT